MFELSGNFKMQKSPIVRFCIENWNPLMKELQRLYEGIVELRKTFV